MTTATERTFEVGQQYRLLPNPTTVTGGGVYLGTATLVEVASAVPGGSTSDPNNINVRAVDGNGAGTTQWVDPAFLASVDGPGGYDWTALDAAFDSFIRSGNIPSPGGSVLSAPTEWKREDMFTVLHEMADEHRRGTLQQFASHRDAGQTYWARVHAMPPRGMRWQYHYNSHVEASEAIGRFLEANRGLIEAAPALGGAQPLNTYVRPERLLEGMLVSYEGRIARVTSVSQNGQYIDLLTWAQSGRNTVVGFASSEIAYVVEGGVTQLRRRDVATGYGNAPRAGEVVTFLREWGGNDHAIYVARDNGLEVYDARWAFEIILPEAAAVLPTRRPAARFDEAWRLSTGNLAYVQDDRRWEQGHTLHAINVHERENERWELRRDVGMADLLLAERGDRIEIVGGTHNGRVGIFCSSLTRSGSVPVDVLLDGDTSEVRVDRDHIRFAAATRSTVEQQPAKPATITHDGEEYVRLADVLADHEKAVQILHQGADDNGLCSVYDKVGRQVDEATLLFKMGSRPRRRRLKGTVTVSVEYDLLTDGTHRTDEEAVTLLREQILAHVTVPDTAPNQDNAYRWRVTGPTVDNTSVEIS